MIDASVAAKWYLRDEDYLPEADALLTGIYGGSVEGSAPYLSRYELASALLVAVRSRRISSTLLGESLRDYAKLDINEPSDPDSLLADAAHLLVEHPIGYYDGVYLAMAEALGGHFVTADAKFYAKARDLFPSVVWLGDIDL